MNFYDYSCLSKLDFLLQKYQELHYCENCIFRNVIKKRETMLEANRRKYSTIKYMIKYENMYFLFHLSYNCMLLNEF